MNELGNALSELAKSLRACKVPFALVGGLAVSVRTEPRFTRDIDVVAVIAPERIDAVTRELVARGHQIESVLADESGKHVAGLRLRGAGIREDVLLAFSGLEPETCASADVMEVLPGVMVPVATLAHLVVLKLLAMAERNRTQDRADAELLAQTATLADQALVASLLPRVRSAHGTDVAKLERLWRSLL